MATVADFVSCNPMTDLKIKWARYDTLLFIIYVRITKFSTAYTIEVVSHCGNNVALTTFELLTEVYYFIESAIYLLNKTWHKGPYMYEPQCHVLFVKLYR